MNQSIKSLSHSETILVVDDDPGNLGALGRLLRPHYYVLTASSGEQALEVAAGPQKPDLILLDVMMPYMDGYHVLEHLRMNIVTRNIPVIFVTGQNSNTDEERGLELGAVDYIAKPYCPPIVLVRIKTQLELKHARDLLENQNINLELEITRRMREILVIQDITINALAELAETRDPETGNHIRRTQEYVRILATHLQSHPRFSAFLTDQVVDLLAKSAPLHDIGKVGIPDHILLKPDKLTSEEWAIMRTHSLLGTVAIQHAVQNADRNIDFLDIAQQIIHFHHEKWDGTGYPEGLKGDCIPIPARLMALADVFDALISRRVYKPEMTTIEARSIICEERGSHFDPDVVDAFLACFDQFVFIAQKYKNSPSLEEKINR